MVWAIFESFVDNVFRDKVSEPEVGGIVYCDLALGLAEHSGIYLGNGEIMHRNSNGLICTVSPRKFLDGTPGISIYTSCHDTRATGWAGAAEQAKYYQKHRNRDGYALLWRNCHIFSSACLTCNEENTDTFMWMLKDTAKKEINANSWRV